MTQTGAILVTGATGAQGGATIDALVRTGIVVRALVRNPLSERARNLADRGIELTQGEFDDQSSLAAAMRGVVGVFYGSFDAFVDAGYAEVNAGAVGADFLEILDILRTWESGGVWVLAYAR